jgi:membrane protein implicated in regulation of membrane protease activity
LRACNKNKKNKMINILKIFLIFLGGALIGFGMGITVINFLILEGMSYWLSFISSLILGGFLLALGIIIGKKSSTKDKKEPDKKVFAEKKEENPEQQVGGGI